LIPQRCWALCGKGCLRENRTERSNGSEGQLMVERGVVRGLNWRNGEPEGKAAAVRGWM